MTEHKTSGWLSIFRRIDAGNVPAPWVPPELPSSTSAAGLPAKLDRTKSPPAPWVPAEPPASSHAPEIAAKSDRAVAKLKPWMPPEAPALHDAPRNLPAAVPDAEEKTLVEPQKRKPRKKERAGELTTTETVQAGQTTINIINQVAAAPVVYAPWWGWWGHCPRAYCPARAGRTCWRLFCWW
jgi:hypothetical protein